MNPPSRINGRPVVASVRKTACGGELQEQHVVICEDIPRDGATINPRYVVWNIAFDPSYLGGSWVAFWGVYDCDLPKAREHMTRKAG